MKIILTEEQLKRIEESTKAGLNETRKPTRLQKLFAKSTARAIQNEFYNDYLVISKLYYKFSQFADNIHGKLYSTNNTWDDDNLKRKMAVIYSQLKEKLEGFGNKYLVNDDKFDELNSQMMDYIKEQIDTEDDERELMSQWYGDDEDEEDEGEFDYAPEYDVDSEDSYDLSHEKDITNKMRRSVRIGGAGAVDKETRQYRIDGKVYNLTPVEYREKLNDMGRITPEKAATMGVSVDSSGIIRIGDDVVAQKMKSLRKKIIAARNEIERAEEEYISQPYARLEEKINYLRTKLEYYLDEYDELTGNVDGEEYDF
jgi:hypothetical protein